MSHILLDSLRRQLLTDLVPSSVIEGLPKPIDLTAKRDILPSSTLSLNGEDMDARLRSIRRYITPRELATLLHWHTETVYRRIKVGMPADRVVDPQGRGRQLKIYPPQVADWLRGCRDGLRRPNPVTSILNRPYSETLKSDKVPENRK